MELSHPLFWKGHWGGRCILKLTGPLRGKEPRRPEALSGRQKAFCTTFNHEPRWGGGSLDLDEEPLHSHTDIQPKHSWKAKVSFNQVTGRPGNPHSFRAVSLGRSGRAGWDSFHFLHGFAILSPSRSQTLAGGDQQEWNLCCQILWNHHAVSIDLGCTLE